MATFPDKTPTPHGICPTCLNDPGAQRWSAEFGVGLIYCPHHMAGAVLNNNVWTIFTPVDYELVQRPHRDHVSSAV